MKTTLFAVTAVAVIACAGPAIEAPTGPGTDYPCGVWGISCGSHMCCDEGDACGGMTGCPDGYCCYVGPDKAKRKANYRQKPEAVR